MKRPWPIIAVSSVLVSSAWYLSILGAQENHPGGTVFNQILDKDGTVLICLHRWGPSGPRGDHYWPSISDKTEDRVGKGLLLWFVVDDFEDAWSRAQDLDVEIIEPPNTDNGTGNLAFVIKDPDGYYVTVNESQEGI